MGSCAGIVECRKDTRRSLSFNEITHDLIVEILNWRPLDLLADVFFLLSLQGELNEDLLKLLVHIVDAQLLEGIVVAVTVEYKLVRSAAYSRAKPRLQNFEAVDIKHTNNERALAL